MYSIYENITSCVRTENQTSSAGAVMSDICCTNTDFHDDKIVTIKNR